MSLNFGLTNRLLTTIIPIEDVEGRFEPLLSAAPL